jgi:hypothetical protein
MYRSRFQRRRLGTSQSRHQLGLEISFQIANRAGFVFGLFCLICLVTTRLCSADPATELVESNAYRDKAQLVLEDAAAVAMSRNGETRALFVEERLEIRIVRTRPESISTLKTGEHVQHLTLSDDGTLLAVEYCGGRNELVDLTSLKSYGLLPALGRLLAIGTSEADRICLVDRGERIDLLRQKLGENVWQSSSLAVGPGLEMCRLRCIKHGDRWHWHIALARFIGVKHYFHFENLDVDSRYEFSFRSIFAEDLKESAEGRVLGDVSGLLRDFELFDDLGSVCVLTARSLTYLTIEKPIANGIIGVRKWSTLIPTSLLAGAVHVHPQISDPQILDVTVAGVPGTNGEAELLYFRMHSRDKFVTLPPTPLSSRYVNVALSDGEEFHEPCVRLLGPTDLCDYEPKELELVLSAQRVSYQGVESFAFGTHGLVFVNCEGGCNILRFHEPQNRCELIKRIDLKNILGVTPEGSFLGVNSSRPCNKCYVPRLFVTDREGANLATFDLPAESKDFKVVQLELKPPILDLRLWGENRHVWFQRRDGGSVTMDLCKWAVKPVDVTFETSAIQIDRNRYLSGLSIDAKSKQRMWSLVDLKEGRIKCQTRWPWEMIGFAPEPVGDERFVVVRSGANSEQLMLSLLDEAGAVLNEITLPMKSKPEINRYQEFVCLPLPEHKLFGLVEKSEGIVYLVTLPELKIVHELHLAKSGVTATGVFPAKPLFFAGYKDGSVQIIHVRNPRNAMK